MLAKFSKDKTIAIYIVICALTILPSLRQSIFALSLPKDLHIEQITAEDGLPNSAIWAINQDHFGFIWLGTSYGLHRYDGVKFKSYIHNPRDSTTIGSNRIKKIYVGPDGDLWVLPLYGGIDRFLQKKDQFKRYRNFGSSGTSNSEKINCVFFDRNKNIWVGTNNGISLYDAVNDEFKRITSQSNDTIQKVYEFAETNNGTLWVATNNGLRRIDKISNSQFEIIKPDISKAWINRPVRSLCVDTVDAKLWVGSQSHGFFSVKQTPSAELMVENVTKSEYAVYRILTRSPGELWIQNERAQLVKYKKQPDGTISRKKTYQYLPNKKEGLSHPIILNCHLDAKNNLWVGTDGGGVNILFDQDSILTWYQSGESSAQSLTGNSVLNIFEDQQGGIWMGTFGKGLNHVSYSNKGFIQYKDTQNKMPNTQSLRNPLVIDLAGASNNQIWVATNGGGLHLFDPSRNHFKIFKYQKNNKNSIPNDKVSSVIEAKDSSVWIGTSGGGLARLNLHNHHIRRFGKMDGLSDHYIYSLMEDAKGRIWVGSRRGIDILLPGKDIFISFKEVFYVLQNDAKIVHIWKLLQDLDGNIWIASEGQGLFKFNENSRTLQNFHYQSDDTHSISSDVIWNIHQDQDKRIWVCTNNGLNLLNEDNETFTVFTAQHGLTNNITLAATSDANGHIWIATKGGLSCLKWPEHTFVNYIEEDGLQSNEFFPAVHKSPDGQIYFGGVNGLNRFDPLDIREKNYYAPKTVLSALYVDNRPVQIDDSLNILENSLLHTHKISLHHSYRIVTLEFTSLNYVNAEKNQFAYRLLPLENEWQYVNTQRRAVYTNLTPGEYLFEVKSANEDGVWNEIPTQLAIAIPPPWWQTWWFKVFGILSLSMLAVFYVKTRINQYESRQQKLEEKVAIRTAEIRAQNKEIRTQQKEILLQNKKLKKINQKLQDLDQQKDGMMKIVAHDLKSPLNRIQGLLQLIQNAQPKESKMDEVFNLAFKVISDGNSLIRDLLDLHNFNKKDHVPLKIEPVKLKEALEIILLSYQDQLNNKKIELATKFDEISIETDVFQLSRVIDNLLSNAIKFSPGNSIIYITLSKYKNTGKIFLSIKDQGPGISLEEQKELYKMFKKLTPRPTAGESSHGLGLAIVKHLIAELNGEIKVISEVGKGTEFIIELPEVWPSEKAMLSTNNNLV